MLDLLKGCIGVELCELERCGIQTTVNEFMLHVCEYNECIINMDMADSLEHLDPSEILRSFQDYTGFECFCNEICIDVACREKCAPSVIELLRCVEGSLNDKYPQKGFCIIISVCFGEHQGINARFHTIRHNEDYLDSDLEHYREPVLCKTIGI